MAKYVRDGRSPIPCKESVSRVMSANRGKNTSPEVRLRLSLFASGLRGYRLHRRDLPGRPDISFSRDRLAIFVNGCFWHRCPECSLPLPNSHREYWVEKFRRNVERDRRKIAALKEVGWRVIVIWEHEVDNDLPRCVDRIRKALGQS